MAVLVPMADTIHSHDNLTVKGALSCSCAHGGHHSQPQGLTSLGVDSCSCAHGGHHSQLTGKPVTYSVLAVLVPMADTIHSY